MRLAALTLAISAAFASLPAQAGDVAGQVFDASGLPVSGVEVSLGEAVTRTGADGSYNFVDVAQGEASLAVHKADGTAQRVWLDVAQQGTSRRNIFLLAPAAIDNALASLLAAEAEEEALEDTFELAESLSEKAAQREERDWNWRDLDA